jgi:hypothetical protein
MDIKKTLSTTTVAAAVAAVAAAAVAVVLQYFHRLAVQHLYQRLRIDLQARSTKIASAMRLQPICEKEFPQVFMKKLDSIFVKFWMHDP